MAKNPRNQGKDIRLDEDLNFTPFLLGWNKLLIKSPIIILGSYPLTFGVMHLKKPKSEEFDSAHCPATAYSGS